LIVRVRDEPRSLLAKQVDAADVVDMALCQQDVTHWAVIHRIEVALVNWGFEAHPGVDHRTPFWRGDQIRVGKPLGQIDEVVDPLRFGL
jgi:hypothetical protein